MISGNEKSAVSGLRRYLITAAVLLVVSLLCLAPAAADSPADTWDGTVDESWYADSGDAFTLTTAEEFAGLASLTNAGTDFTGKKITLGADIDLSGREWSPIGKSKNHPFSGTVLGGGHTVSGLQVRAGDLEYCGLFGCIAEKGTVRDLAVTGSISVTADDDVFAGGVAGYTAGTIAYCSSAVSVQAASAGSAEIYAGGISGVNDGGKILNSYVAGTVSAAGSDTVYAGGITGQNDGYLRVDDAHPDGKPIAGTIQNCFTAGSVSAQGLTVFAGGVSGENRGTVSRCYTTGSVSADASGEDNIAYAGGICGFTFGASEPSLGAISACYALNNAVSAEASGGDVSAGISVSSGGTVSGYCWDSMAVTDSAKTPIDSFWMVESGTPVSSAEVWDTGFFGDTKDWKAGTEENFLLPVLTGVAGPYGADASYLKPGYVGAGSSAAAETPVSVWGALLGFAAAGLLLRRR